MMRSSLLVCGLLGLALVTQVSAAPPKLADSGTDVVSIKAGPRLQGAILNRAADGTVAIAVQRSWLARRGAKYYEQQLKKEAASALAAIRQCLERIADWKDLRAADLELVKFLVKESDRLKAFQTDLEAGRPLPTRFMRIEVPAPHIERVTVQPADRRQVAIAAWHEQIPDVEDTTVAALATELKRRGIDFANRRFDLSPELPPAVQTEEQWAARQAVVEFSLRRSLTFQGTQELLVRTGDGAAPPDMTRLIGELFKSQLEGQLADLLGEGGASKPREDAGNKALNEAQQTAEREGVSGFRVTRLAFQLANKTVSVEGRFLARMPNGTWRTIWQQTETLDASKPQEDAEKELAEDPQIKQVLTIAKAGGFGADDNQIRQALRFGAATRTAQETADTRFFEFFDRYVQHVDGPPLVLPAPTGGGVLPPH